MRLTLSPLTDKHISHISNILQRMRKTMGVFHEDHNEVGLKTTENQEVTKMLEVLV